VPLYVKWRLCLAFLQTYLQEVSKWGVQGLLRLWRTLPIYYLRRAIVIALAIRLIIRLVSGQIAQAIFWDELTINLIAQWIAD